MEQWQNSLWEYFKIIAPLLTGGLAGSILTYLLNQRAARRKVPRLLLNVESVNYALSSRDEDFKDLRVSYKSIEYENLVLYNAKLKNISTKSVSKAPFLIKTSAHVDIVDKSLTTHPINRKIDIVKQEDHDDIYVWDAGELQPNDSAEIRILLSPAADVEWLWRGDSEVEVTSTGREISIDVDRELRNVVAWIAVFVLLGGLPVFQGILQGVFIFVTAPFIISYFIRIRSVLLDKKGMSYNISLGHSSNVSIDYGGKISKTDQRLSDIQRK